MTTTARIMLDHTFPIPPGSNIRRWMEDEGISPTEFSRRIGLSVQSVYLILDGKQAITPETASGLELVTGAPAGFFLRLEANYQLALRRENAMAEEDRMKAWVKSFPVGDLWRRGALPSDFPKMDALRQHESVLQFFGVANEKAYNESFNRKLFAARTVRGLKSDEPALMAWVQLGRREAEKQETKPFDVVRFKALLRNLRLDTMALSQKDESVKDWLLRLRDQCREVGVGLVFIRPLTGVRHVAGAAHWLKEKPVIQLSLHGKSIDRILFFFCHEAAHVLDGRHGLSYVTCDEGDESETEADASASAILLPGVSDERIVSAGSSIAGLERLAAECRVYPGVVFGRYCKLTGYKRNLRILRLIRKFEWPDKSTWFLA